MSGPKILSQGAGLNASSAQLLRDPLNLLAANRLIEHRFRFSGRIRREEVAWADLLVFQQSQENIDIRVLEMARHLGKKVVFQADDDYLDIPPGHFKTRHFDYPHRKRNYLEFIRSADLVLVTTRYLAEAFAAYRGGDVKHADDLPVAQELLASSPRHSTDGVFRFVYATCPANYRHLRASGAAEAVHKVTKVYGQKVRFIFMGGGHDFGFDSRFCEFIPRLPLEKFFELFSSMTIDCGLAPLVGDSYSLGKSDLKYREYAARGLAGIYSLLPVHTRSMKNGRTGLLIENGVDNWYAAMTWLLEHQSEAWRMGQAARLVAEERFTMSRWADFWLEQVINPLLESRASPVGRVSSPKSCDRGQRCFRSLFIYEAARCCDAVWRRIRTFWYNAFYLDRYPAVTRFLAIFRSTEK